LCALCVPVQLYEIMMMMMITVTDIDRHTDRHTNRHATERITSPPAWVVLM